MKSTSMKTTRESLERLRVYGKLGESFDTALNRVLDKVEGKES